MKLDSSAERFDISSKLSRCPQREGVSMCEPGQFSRKTPGRGHVNISEQDRNDVFAVPVRRHQFFPDPVRFGLVNGVEPCGADESENHVGFSNFLIDSRCEIFTDADGVLVDEDTVLAVPPSKWLSDLSDDVLPVRSLIRDENLRGLH